MHNFNHPDQQKNYMDYKNLYSGRMPVQVFQKITSDPNPYVVNKNTAQDDLEVQFSSEEEVPDEILMQRKNVLLEYISYLDFHQMLPWQENYTGPTLVSQTDSNNFTECHRNPQSLIVEPQINSPTFITFPPSPPSEYEVDEPAEEEVMSGFVEDMKENNSDIYYQLAAKALAVKVIRLQSIIQAHGIEIEEDLKMSGPTTAPSYQREPTYHNTLKEASSEGKISNISNMNLTRPSNCLPAHNKCSTLITNPKKMLNQPEVNIRSMIPTFSKYGRTMMENQNTMIHRREDRQNPEKQQFANRLPETRTNNVARKCPLTEPNDLQSRFKKYMKKRCREESFLSQLQGNRRNSKRPRGSQFQNSALPDNEEESDDEQEGLEAVVDFIQLLAAVVNKKTNNKAEVKPPSRDIEKHDETPVISNCVEQTPAIPTSANNHVICAIEETEKQPIKGMKRDIAMLPNGDAHHASNDYFLYDSDEDFDFESDESD